MGLRGGFVEMVKKEIIITKPIQGYFYDIEHNLNCYPLIWTSDRKYHGLGFNDKNNCYICNMEGFTGKIILIGD